MSERSFRDSLCTRNETRYGTRNYKNKILNNLTSFLHPALLLLWWYRQSCSSGGSVYDMKAGEQPFCALLSLESGLEQAAPLWGVLRAGGGAGGGAGEGAGGSQPRMELMVAGRS